MKEGEGVGGGEEVDSGPVGREDDGGDVLRGGQGDRWGGCTRETVRRVAGRTPIETGGGLLVGLGGGSTSVKKCSKKTEV